MYAQRSVFEREGSNLSSLMTDYPKCAGIAMPSRGELQEKYKQLFIQQEKQKKNQTKEAAAAVASSSTSAAAAGSTSQTKLKDRDRERSRSPVKSKSHSTVKESQVLSPTGKSKLSHQQSQESSTSTITTAATSTKGSYQKGESQVQKNQKSNSNLTMLRSNSSQSSNGGSTGGITILTPGYSPSVVPAKGGSKKGQQSVGSGSNLAINSNESHTEKNSHLQHSKGSELFGLGNNLTNSSNIGGTGLTASISSASALNQCPSSASNLSNANVEEKWDRIKDLMNDYSQMLQCRCPSDSHAKFEYPDISKTLLIVTVEKKDEKKEEKIEEQVNSSTDAVVVEGNTTSAMDVEKKEEYEQQQQQQQQLLSVKNEEQLENEGGLNRNNDMEEEEEDEELRVDLEKFIRDDTLLDCDRLIELKLISDFQDGQKNQNAAAKNQAGSNSNNNNMVPMPSQSSIIEEEKQVSLTTQNAKRDVGSKKKTKEKGKANAGGGSVAGLAETNGMSTNSSQLISTAEGVPPATVAVVETLPEIDIRRFISEYIALNSERLSGKDALFAMHPDIAEVTSFKGALSQKQWKLELASFFIGQECLNPVAKEVSMQKCQDERLRNVFRIRKLPERIPSKEFFKVFKANFLIQVYYGAKGRSIKQEGAIIVGEEMAIELRVNSGDATKAERESNITPTEVKQSA